MAYNITTGHCPRTGDREKDIEYMRMTIDSLIDEIGTYMPNIDSRLMNIEPLDIPENKDKGV